MYIHDGQLVNEIVFKWNRWYLSRSLINNKTDLRRSYFIGDDVVLIAPSRRGDNSLCFLSSLIWSRLWACPMSWLRIIVYNVCAFLCPKFTLSLWASVIIVVEFVDVILRFGGNFRKQINPYIKTKDIPDRWLTSLWLGRQVLLLIIHIEIKR